MKLKVYVENHGKKIIIIFVLIDLKRENEKDIVFVMKTKTNDNRSNTSDETFLKTYDCYSHKYSRICSYKSMNKTIGVDHILIFFKQSHSHFCKQSHSLSFKCYIQLKMKKI